MISAHLLAHNFQYILYFLFFRIRCYEFQTCRDQKEGGDSNLSM